MTTATPQELINTLNLHDYVNLFYTISVVITLLNPHTCSCDSGAYRLSNSCMQTPRTFRNLRKNCIPPLSSRFRFATLPEPAGFFYRVRVAMTLGIRVTGTKFSGLGRYKCNFFHVDSL